MKKRNLILPLFLGSFFITSNVDSAVFELYERQNNNLLIAGGDCGGSGGSTPAEKKAKKERRQKVMDDAKIRIIKSKIAADKPLTDKEKKIIELNPNDFPPILEIIGGDPITRDPSTSSNFKKLNENQLNTIKQKTKTMMEEIWEPYKRIAEENKRRKESGLYAEDGFIDELMGLSPRSLNFTTAALDSREDGNEARAETYHKLAIKSLESSLNKNEVDSSEEHHHHDLLAVNYYYLDDFENSNKSLRKSASGYKKTEKKDLTKTLIATTSILSGNVNQGCQDLYDYFADGDISFDSTFPIEDFCIFDEEKFK